MKKINMKKLVSVITNIVCYGALLFLWGIVVFAMTSVAFGASYMDDILVWYEKRMHNFPFEIASMVVLVLLTISIVYGLSMQTKFQKNLKKR